jgi:predicted PurR-regulated permease PerM
MELDHKLLKEISAIVVIILFGVLVFLSIKPSSMAIAWGFILAYVFMPVYKQIHKYTKNDIFSASVTLVLALLIVALPLWFLLPTAFQQVFELYKLSQSLDVTGFLSSILPSASPQLLTQFTAAINTFLGNFASTILNSIVTTTLDLPLIFIDIVVVAFVFFFSLKDSDKIIAFVKSISPLSKSNEKIVIKQFKDITYSTIYGRFIVGLIQGLFAGLGFLIFGVGNTLVLTIGAIILGVLPVVGVFLIWIPLAIYMFVSGHIVAAIIFTLYNLIIVTNIDNLISIYIISKKTTLSPFIALISSIGGLFLFGVIGLILGPLIFAYFIILLDLYRNKNLLSLFSEEEPSGESKKSETK